jgi:hypothetical protein
MAIVAKRKVFAAYAQMSKAAGGSIRTTAARSG